MTKSMNNSTCPLLAGIQLVPEACTRCLLSELWRDCQITVCFACMLHFALSALPFVSFYFGSVFCLGKKNRWCILYVIRFIWRLYAMSKTNYVNLFRINALISFPLRWRQRHVQDKGLKGSMTKGQDNAPGLRNLVCYVPLHSLGSVVSWD